MEIAYMIFAALVSVGSLYVGYLAVERQVRIGVASLVQNIRLRLSRGRAFVARRILRQLPTYAVGCFNYEPLIRRNQFERAAETPEFEGPWAVLIADVAKRLDVNIETRFVSARDLSNAESIAADLVMGLFETPRRRLHFDFSVPFHRIRLQGICKRGRPKISKDELVSGNLQVVIQPGEVGWEYVEEQLEALKAKGKVTEFPSELTFEIIHMLLSERHHVAVCDEISCLHFLKKFDTEHRYQLAFDFALPAYPVCIGVKRQLAWDMRALNEAIKEARNTPAFRTLESEWLTDEYDAVIEKCYLRSD